MSLESDNLFCFTRVVADWLGWNPYHRNSFCPVSNWLISNSKFCIDLLIVGTSCLHCWDNVIIDEYANISNNMPDTFFHTHHLHYTPHSGDKALTQVIWVLRKLTLVFLLLFFEKGGDKNTSTIAAWFGLSRLWRSWLTYHLSTWRLENKTMAAGRVSSLKPHCVSLTPRTHRNHTRKWKPYMRIVRKNERWKQT